jgi:hypothetical protein
VRLADDGLDVRPVCDGLHPEVVEGARPPLAEEDAVHSSVPARDRGRARQRDEVHGVGPDRLDDVGEQAEVVHPLVAEVPDVPVRARVRVAPGTGPQQNQQVEARVPREQPRSVDRTGCHGVTVARELEAPSAAVPTRGVVPALVPWRA